MTALRAFEAVIRHGSLSGAARELHVTPAAISHRLRSLQEIAGRPLLYREGRRFQPTALGQDVVKTLGDAFQRIGEADSALRSGQLVRLHIGAAYSFATLWLSPRLIEFTKDHPRIEPHLHPSHHPLGEPSVDVSIVHSDKQPDGPGWDLLFADTCAVLGRADHPAVQENGPGVAGLGDAQLIHITHRTGAQAGEYSWQDWFDAQGLHRHPSIRRGTRVTAEHLAVEMVLRGDTLALISTVNAHDYLRSGRLATVPGSAVKSNRSYWLKRVDAPATDDASRAFEKWLRQHLKTALNART